jgi:hypothetical protein
LGLALHLELVLRKKQNGFELHHQLTQLVHRELIGIVGVDEALFDCDVLDEGVLHAIVVVIELPGRVDVVVEVL